MEGCFTFQWEGVFFRWGDFIFKWEVRPMEMISFGGGVFEKNCRMGKGAPSSSPTKKNCDRRSLLRIQKLLMEIFYWL